MSVFTEAYRTWRAERHNAPATNEELGDIAAQLAPLLQMRVHVHDAGLSDVLKLATPAELDALRAVSPDVGPHLTKAGL